MIQFPSGTCITCDGSTTRLEGARWQGAVNGLLLLESQYTLSGDRSTYEGSCVTPCASDAYLTIDRMYDSGALMCREKRAAGDPCDSLDPGHTGYFGIGDEICKSGLCGHKACCAESTCASGICEEGTGACLTSGTALPGESCFDSQDCYGGNPCLGGRCCFFTQSQFSDIYDMNRFKGCLACGDTEMYEETGMIQFPSGTCITCDGSTTRLEGARWQGAVNGLLTLEEPVHALSGDRSTYEGSCVTPCASDAYLTIDRMYDSGALMCREKRAAGDPCDSLDPGHTGYFGIGTRFANLGFADTRRAAPRARAHRVFAKKAPGHA